MGELRCSSAKPLTEQNGIADAKKVPFKKVWAYLQAVIFDKFSSMEVAQLRGRV
jgi:hypothetical protein